MRTSIVVSACFALGCYAAESNPVNPRQLEHLYGDYQVNLDAQSICYTYMTTALITGTALPTTTVTNNTTQTTTSVLLSSLIGSSTQSDPPETTGGTVPRPRPLSNPLAVPGAALPPDDTTITEQGTGTTTNTTTVPPSGTDSGTVILEDLLPTFDCDPSGYLIQDTALYRVNIKTGSSELVNANVGDGRNINGMGYNIADNFLYATIGGAPGNLIRISASGASTILGTLDLRVPVTTGDVDENSQYWITANGRQWAQIDLDPSSPTFGTTQATGTTSLTDRAVIDWAYVPGGGNALYGLGFDSFYSTTVLMRFDRAAHVWTELTNFGNIAGGNGWGAVYASDDGYLYGSENVSGQIWRFPLPASGTAAVRISNGPRNFNNDGARCIRAANL